LIKVIESELSQFGMSNAKLVHESYDPQNFGNAEAIYKLGNVQLRFLRDRGDDIVDIGSASRPQYFYNSYDVAVWADWISFDDLMKYYHAPINFADPPTGPIFSLPKMISLIARDLRLLNKAFSAEEFMSTNAELKEIERKRIKSTWNF